MDLSLIWIPATLAAAAAQTARNAMQHRLTETLGTIGATQVRFLYGLPFAAIFMLAITTLIGEPVPTATPVFLTWVTGGAVFQIAATALMLAAMAVRSFGTAITYTKIEPVLVAIFGLVILGDTLTFWGALAIMVATFGVFLLSRPAGGGAAGRDGLRAAALGLASGACFALSANAFRAAIVMLPEASFAMRASTTLVWVLAFQSVMLLAWLAVANRPALTGSLRIWRSSLFAGFMGALASQLWFIGFSLTAAANVRTLGLVEVLFAAVVSRRLFAQTISWREWAGYGIVTAGVGLLVLSAH